MLLNFNSMSRNRERKTLLRIVPIVSVLLVGILLAGGISRANAAGTTKLSPDILCITCGPTGHPYAISATVDGGNVSGTVTPSEQTATAIITPPDGASGYSGVVDSENKTIEIWVPNGYERMTLIENNGAPYVEIELSFTPPGNDAQLAGQQGANSETLQPMIQDEPGITCIVSAAMDGTLIDYDSVCIQELEQLEQEYMIDPWFDPMYQYYLDNQDQINACAGYVSAALLTAAGIYAAARLGKPGLAVAIGDGIVLYQGDVSGFFQYEYTTCMGGP